MQYVGPNLVGNFNPRVWTANVPYAKLETVLSSLDGELYRRITETGSGTVDPADDVVNFEAVSYERTLTLPEPTSLLISSNGSGVAQIAGGATKIPFGASAGQRVKVIDRLGKCRFTFAGLFQGGAGARNWRMEIKVDGRVISDYTIASNIARSAVAFCGTFVSNGMNGVAYPYSSIADIGGGVEVKRSLEIWVTCSVDNFTNGDYFMYALVGYESQLYSAPSIPTLPAPAATSGTISFLNNNDLDFMYTSPQPGTWDSRYHTELICTVNASTFFANGGNHLVFALDTEGGQGTNNPHCGPIIRNGENLWANARGIIVFGDATVQSERWVSSVSPITAGISSTAGTGWNATTAKGTWTIRINAGYIGGAQYSTRMRVRIYSGTSIAGTLMFDGQTAETTTWQWFYAQSNKRAAIGGIGPGFVAPSDTGCVEQKVSRTAAGANFAYSNYTLTGVL